MKLCSGVEGKNAVLCANERPRSQNLYGVGVIISGANHVDNLFQTVGQVSKAVGTLVNILTVDSEETTATTTSMRIQSQ